MKTEEKSLGYIMKDGQRTPLLMSVPFQLHLQIQDRPRH
jgi:hypothetical protein